MYLFMRVSASLYMAVLDGHLKRGWQSTYQIWRVQFKVCECVDHLFSSSVDELFRCQSRSEE